MASSQQRESSFANEQISFFTKAFFDAATSKNLEEDVYYRDIQSYVADAFKEDRLQTPLFVSQITGLEVFAKSNNEIQSLKAKYKILIQKRNEEKSASERILEIVEEKEAYYLKQEIVDEYLSCLEPSRLQLNLTDEISKSLYKIVNVDSISLQDIGSARKIAQKVEQAKWAHDCFVSFEKEKYQVRQIRGNLSTLERIQINLNSVNANMTGKELDPSYYEVVTKDRAVNIKIEYKMPFDCLRLEIKPFRSCLSPWNSYLFIIPARTYFVLVLGFAKLHRFSWDKFQLNPPEIEWTFDEVFWKDWQSCLPITTLMRETEKRLRQDILQLTGIILIDDENEENEEIGLQ